MHAYERVDTRTAPCTTLRMSRRTAPFRVITPASVSVSQFVTYLSVRNCQSLFPYFFLGALLQVARQFQTQVFPWANSSERSGILLCQPA